MRLIFLMAAFTMAALSQTILTGELVGCWDGRLELRAGVSIYAFDARLHPELLNNIEELIALSALGPAADPSGEKALILQQQLKEIVGRTERLADAKTAKHGAFTLRLRRHVDDVLVLAYVPGGLQEDGDYLEYTRIQAREPARVHVVLGSVDSTCRAIYPIRSSRTARK